VLNLSFVAPGVSFTAGPTSVPEPSTLSLAAMGLLLTLGLAWRRRAAAPT
jgi:hypothetical protein